MRTHAGLPLIALSVVACIDPTQVTLEISSDLCASITDTSVTVGEVGQIEMADPAAIQTGCEVATIGTLAVVPSGEDQNAAFGLKVVSSVGQLIETCQPPEYGPQCIIARRSLQFVDELHQRVPVRMREACLGVLCPESQTCIDGVCANVDSLEPGVPFAWQRTYGSIGDDLLYDIARVPGGDVVVAGSMSTSIDLGTGPLASRGGFDAFIARVLPDGTPRWVSTFGGVGDDTGVAVDAGPTGLLHLSGTYSDEINLGGGLQGGFGGRDAFVATYLGLGTFGWSVVFGGAGADAAAAVAGDADQNVYVGGSFEDAMTIEGELLSGAAVEGFVASFDPTGAPRWSLSIGGDEDDAVTEVAVFGDAVYVTGSFEGRAMFGDSELFTRGQRDVFVARLDAASGAVQWVRPFGSVVNDVSVALSLSREGDRIAIAGALAGSASFGTVAMLVDPAATQDAFVLVVDEDGEYVWSSTFGGFYADGVEALAFDGGGNLSASGFYAGAVNVGDHTLPDQGGVRSLFVTTFDEVGTPLWARAFPAGDFASIRGLAPSFGGSLFVGGYYRPDVRVNNKLLRSAGGTDVFIGRILAPAENGEEPR